MKIYKIHQYFFRVAIAAFINSLLKSQRNEIISFNVVNVFHITMKVKF